MADIDWGPLAQRLTFCQEQEQNSVNVASTPVQPPLFHPTFMIMLHDITDTSTFRKRLKNVLFDRAYNWLLLALLDVSYSGALQISHWLIDWLIDYTLSASCSHTKQCNLVMDKKCRCSAAEKMTADLAQSNGTRYIMSEIKIFAFGWE